MVFGNIYIQDYILYIGGIVYMDYMLTLLSGSDSRLPTCFFSLSQRFRA